MIIMRQMVFVKVLFIVLTVAVLTQLTSPINVNYYVVQPRRAFLQLTCQQMMSAVYVHFSPCITGKSPRWMTVTNEKLKLINNTVTYYVQLFRLHSASQNVLLLFVKMCTSFNCVYNKTCYGVIN